MAGKKNKQSQGDVAVLEKTKTKRPKLFKVLLHNDDYTPMEFVIDILVEIFHKNDMEAQHIMWTVHVKGHGLCGVFPFAVAESKVDKVMSLARQEEHPLLCTMEAE